MSKIKTRNIYVSYPISDFDIDIIPKICIKICQLFPKCYVYSSFIYDSFMNLKKDAHLHEWDRILKCDEIWFFGNWKKSKECMMQNFFMENSSLDLSSEAVFIYKYKHDKKKNDPMDKFIEWLKENVYVW